VKSASIALLALTAWASVAAAAQAPRAASWDEQNHAMIYLIMDLSSINAINGINLTRDQAVRLRNLAREIKAASPQDPDVAGTFRPDLAEVRDTYLEVRRRLLAGEEIPADLEARVAKARTIETKVLRLSLANPSPGAAGCGRCHGTPDVADVRSPAETKTILDRAMPPKPPVAQSFFAHETSLVGQAGLVKLAQFAPQVDAILTAEQKDVLGSFTCCLVPPKSMKDPVRAGQAASGEKEIAILRWVRGVPAATWPAVKAASLEHWKAALVVRSPGAGEDRKNEVAARVGQIYEQARRLSDTDFEMAKDRLATRLHEVAQPTKEQGEREHRFSTAMFLIGSGTVEAYDHLIKRLDGGQGRKP
jgi:hypothetical protein